jgi:hypothetical protein
MLRGLVRQGTTSLDAETSEKDEVNGNGESVETGQSGQERQKRPGRPEGQPAAGCHQWRSGPLLSRLSRHDCQLDHRGRSVRTAHARWTVSHSCRRLTQLHGCPRNVARFDVPRARAHPLLLGILGLPGPHGSTFGGTGRDLPGVPRLSVWQGGMPRDPTNVAVRDAPGTELHGLSVPTNGERC